MPCKLHTYKQYRIYAAAKQHLKKRPLNTINLYKEVASNTPLCKNPCNPPHTVAITTRKIEILFGKTHLFAKMLPQISVKNFSLYCLSIFSSTTDATKFSINKMSS